MDSLTLPRSVLLALWLADPALDSTTAPQLLKAVQGEDEPHRIILTDAPHPLLPTAAQMLGQISLADLVAAWIDTSRTVTAVLPAPGDPSGVPSQVAGEAVLISTPQGNWAAVPQVAEFGSVYELGHHVAWEVCRIPAWREGLVGQVGTLREAERELAGALTRATEALTSLDVARWREDAAATIASLADGSPPHWALPPHLDPQRQRTLAIAARLRAIVDLATTDDGAAVNLWQTDQRTTALRDVDHAARHAMAAATYPNPED